MVAVAGWLLAADRALRLHFANDTVKMLRANALTPLTLTDAEREAVERASNALFGVEEWDPDEAEKDQEALATLRGLLERL